ncbi:MAG: acyl-ACP--UDP-N-acetylglucosamine O-acyltransferase [Flavobacteriales bacterium]
MELKANIHNGAKVGKGTIVEPFATVYGDVEIGENCWIGPNVTIFDGARIGNNVKIFPGAVISPESQDLKYDGEYTTVEIGDGTVIREFVSIHRGTKDRMKTTIGSHCLLMAYVHVAHDCQIGNHVIIANSVGLSGHVTIDDYAIIEGMVGVQQFVHIGEHSFIGGGSLVRKNVPPYVKAAREPLSFIGVNSIGLRRRGFTDHQITLIEDIYRAIYVHNSNITQALKVVDQELPKSLEKDKIVNFINASTKGIMRGPF